MVLGRLTDLGLQKRRIEQRRQLSFYLKDRRVATAVVKEEQWILRIQQHTVQDIFIQDIQCFEF